MRYNDYLDKVRACWLGKNIGGTLGAPFESFRCAVDLEYYTHDLQVGVLPNDDLDLQLVWLNAAERHTTSLDAEVLSSYWVTGITAYWSEYGAGMNNLDNGILPPRLRCLSQSVQRELWRLHPQRNLGLSCTGSPGDRRKIRLRRRLHRPQRRRHLGRAILRSFAKRRICGV